MIERARKATSPVKPPPGKVHLSIYVPAEMRKQLRLLAAEDDRTITEIVETFIADGLAALRRRASTP